MGHDGQLRRGFFFVHKDDGADEQYFQLFIDSTEKELPVQLVGEKCWRNFILDIEIVEREAPVIAAVWRDESRPGELVLACAERDRYLIPTLDNEFTKSISVGIVPRDFGFSRVSTEGYIARRELQVDFQRTP